MTNEEIIDTTRGTELWQYYGEEVNKLLNLARQDEREKCLKILAGKMFELQFIFNKVYEKTYQDRETLTLPEIQQRIADIADVMQRIKVESEQQDEREKMQGVDAWVSVDLSGDCAQMWFKEQPTSDENGDYNCSAAGDFVSFDQLEVKEVMSNFNISPGQCKKFRIVEVLT